MPRRRVTQITPEQLTAAIKAFIRDNSEGGKRAQAVVAGLMDVYAGVDRVESGRINDPSRGYPGDVCIRSADDEEWEKSFEVRDKVAAASDVQIFANKCISMGVREAAVVMVAEGQETLGAEALSAGAAERGMGLTLFTAGTASSSKRSSGRTCRSSTARERLSPSYASACRRSRNR